MMRNLIVLGCAGLLALGLSISSFAGVDPDQDLDGVTDSNDNCLVDPNGPGGGACAAQEDGDSDGYGNTCDSDFNNNGATDPVDLGTMISAASSVSTVLNTDLNCNGAADPVDLGTVLGDSIAVKIVGPSGLACAGSAPCP